MQHFLHHQPHLFLCQFKRKDLIFFSSGKFPTLHLLAGTDAGISEGGKISGYILKLYFLALHVTNPRNIYPFVLSRGLLFAVPAVF